MDGPGQVSRLPPDLVKAITGILSGVYDGSRDEPGRHSPNSDGRRKSLTDDLLGLGGGSSSSPSNRFNMAGATTRLMTSDGQRSHYLGLELAPTTATPSGPLERFWNEPQRHERIAFMMQQFEEAPVRPAKTVPVCGHSVRIKPATAPSSPELKMARGDVGSEASSPRRISKSPSPGSCSRLEIDAQLEVDADVDMKAVPDLEAIRIAARIKTEQIYRRGQRECRLGRIRKKICKAKRTRDVDPG